MAKTKKVPAGPKTLIFRPWITTKDGRRIYAAAYGLRAFPVLVRK